jgi:hypothetical protein
MLVFVVATYAGVEKEFLSLAHRLDRDAFLLVPLIETH